MVVGEVSEGTGKKRERGLVEGVPPTREEVTRPLLRPGRERVPPRSWSRVGPSTTVDQGRGECDTSPEDTQSSVNRVRGRK